MEEHIVTKPTLDYFLRYKGCKTLITIHVRHFTSYARIFQSYKDVTITSMKGFNFWHILCIHDQLDFFCVSHLLWHWTFIYNSHLLEPATLTPGGERLAMELSLPVFQHLGLSQTGIEKRKLYQLSYSGGHYRSERNNITQMTFIEETYGVRIGPFAKA